jgi:hypothetical protein
MANYIPIDRLGEDFDEDRGAMTPTRRRKIHKHRKWADVYGPELPYDFGQFRNKGKKRRDVGIECSECGRAIFVSKDTCTVICQCGEVYNLKK